MTYEQKILSSLKEIDDLNLPSIQDSLNKIIDCHCDVLNSLYDAKIKFEPWKVFIETLIAKIIFTSKSILKISNGEILKSQKTSIKIEIIDTPSMYILARSVIENFLTLEYLYFNNLKDDEKEFRYKLWKISGLISRQSYTIRYKKEFEKIKTAEKEKIEVLKKEIKSSLFFKNLNKGQISKLNNHGLPRLFSWNDLIKKSNLKSDFFKDSYSLFSNYAHSEYISMMQVNESSLSKNDKKNIDNVTLTLSLIRMINCVTIFFLKKNYKCAEIIYNSLPSNTIYTIETWKNIAFKK